MDVGLANHHDNAGAASCVGCHPGTPAPENTPVPGYATITASLDPCDGSEERWTPGTTSLDNDGDLLYDSADPDCGPAAPQIDVDPASNDFGDVTVGNTSAVEVTISNTGTADLDLFDGVLSDTTNFSLDLNGGTNPCTDTPPPIAPGGNCTVSAAFMPQSVAAFTATITVTSNDPTNSPLDIPLSGNGVAVATPNIAVSPATVDFGEVNVGNTPATEVTLSNTGSADLVVSGIALDNAAVYSVDETGGANPCGTLTPTIVAGDNCTVDVIFAPAADGGPFNANVTIDSNDPDTPSAVVPLTGTGFEDTDGDGVGDSVDDFPNDDSKATPQSATGTGKITVDAGTNALSMVAAVALAPGQTVSGFTFPDGLVTFQVAVPAPGDNAVVTLTFPSGQPSGGKYFKDDGSGTLVEFAGATVNTDNVVLMLTDGGSGDNDNTADSVINDPGGLATPVSSGGGGGGGCSVIGSGINGGGGAVLFLTLLAILVTLRRQRARARR
ncbi:MAG: choice-of-anchor D domain-containing protein [Deltaproteobacteria bacterium]|nr:choice-of-anchor D domain-containing protein [Deltaproteobacteria bacterium]